MSFNLIVHHLCVCVYEPYMNFRGGRTHIQRAIDLDKWSFFECVEVVKDLGYSVGKFKMWWRTKEDAVDHIFRPILGDSDAMVLGTYAVNNRADVEMFVEHDLHELTHTPLAVIPPTTEGQSSVGVSQNIPPKKVDVQRSGANKPFKPPAKKVVGGNNAAPKQHVRRSNRIIAAGGASKKSTDRAPILLLSSDDSGGEEERAETGCADEGGIDADNEMNDQVVDEELGPDDEASSDSICDDEIPTKDVHFSDSEEERENDNCDGFENPSIGVAEALLNEKLRQMAEGTTEGLGVEEDIDGTGAAQNHTMEDGWDSEELVSESSDDEGDGVRNENRFNQYREQDMRAEFKFSVGMEFTSLQQFKDAVREHSVLNGRQIQFVKNDGTDAGQFAKKRLVVFLFFVGRWEGRRPLVSRL